MQILVQDIRYALRLLAKYPAVTAVSVMALALGIGANTAIFSIVNAALIRPLEYREPGRIVSVWDANPTVQLGIDLLPASVPNYVDWREQNHAFEEMAAMTSEELHLTQAGEPERLVAARVTAGLFPVLGARPLLGRTFLPEEDKSGSGDVVVVGYGLWQRRWGGDAGLVGRRIMLNGVSHTVVGIMPKGFSFPKGSETPAYFQFGQQTELWVPAAFSPERLRWRGSHSVAVLARLKPGVTIGQAQAEMSAIARRLEQQHPDFNKGWGVRLLSLQESIVTGVRPILLVLMAAVGFVLLIACVNVANLLLGRAVARQREVAIRLTVGASGWQLIRQMLTESLVLALAGGTAGLALGFWGVRMLEALTPSDLPRIHDAALDLRVAAFTFAISLATGLLFGLAPALESSRTDLCQTLKEGSRTLSGGARQGLRSLLVASEVAMSLVLLVGAGLLIQSFLKLHRIDPGFRPENVLVVELSFPDSPTYRASGRKTVFLQQLVERVGSLPGVMGAAAISELPLGGREEVEAISVEGQPRPDSDPFIADQREITAGYFQTMAIPVLKGRAFTAQDTKESLPVAVIDDVMARRYWPNQDPIGKRFKIGSMNSKTPWLVVLGVAGSVKHSALGAEGRPEFFLPCAQREWQQMALVARSAVDPSSLAQAVKREVWKLDADQPVSRVTTMQVLVSDSVALPRFHSLLLGIFAGLALLLAGIGIYGVMSYSVTQRTHEIGVRMALGAAPGDVLRMLVGRSLALALAGTAAGLVAALALSRLLAGFLFGVTPTDAWTYAGISGLLLGVAGLASYLPARRALRVDPMIALRQE
ncbi:MAG TPA: ABC transporter permease [Bryobacteraceae bacterium]|nr:ABC transporter permease [Bryobacteraceae bacterium]